MTAVSGSQRVRPLNSFVLFNIQPRGGNFIAEAY